MEQITEKLMKINSELAEAWCMLRSEGNVDPRELSTTIDTLDTWVGVIKDEVKAIERRDKK